MSVGFDHDHPQSTTDVFLFFTVRLSSSLVVLISSDGNDIVN